MKSIMAQTVWFDSDTDNARLFLLEDTANVLVPSQHFDTSSTVMDNAFCLPRGIDYDPSLARLVYCDQANHRVGWIDDPAPEQPGCWYSERVAAHGFRYRHTGEISRYFTDGDDPYFEIGQQLWTAFADETGGDVQINAFNTDFDAVVSRTIHSGIVPGETFRVEDFTLVSDSYSSLYLFYTLQPSNGQRRICWNSDTLKCLGDGDDHTFYRFTHPYDVSIIPPAPVSHPDGYSGSDGFGGYWLADMGGNRLVRMTRDGHIAAATAPDTVIAPHAVSAARDGSCWAIDWGRERVVKVDPHGNIVARTTPCAGSRTPDGAPCIIHPSALDCGGDPDTCYVADYEGNTVYKVSLENGTLGVTRSEAGYFRPSALEVVKTDTGDVLWVADHKSMAPTPVPGTWTPVILPPPTPTPPPGQRYTPLPSTPFPENFRISKNVFGEADISQWPATAPLNLSPMDSEHCWVADRDAGTYMNNEIRRLSPEGCTSIVGNIYHEVSMPIDVKYVGPGVTPSIPPAETRAEIQAKTPTEIQAPKQAEFKDDTPVDTEAEKNAKTFGENPELIATQKQPPDRDNPFTGFYCGHLEEHLPWCRRMHLGYSKNQMHNVIIPYLKSRNSVNDKHISKLVDAIENVYAKYNVIPWVSLSLNRVVAGFSTPDDVTVFFDQYGKAINDWFQILGTRLNHLNTEYDLKPRRYRFENEANVYRYTGKPVIYYETTRHIYPIFKAHLRDASMVISIAATETYHVEAYLRPLLEYHRDHFPKEPLPFDGIQASCHGGRYMHSVDVHYFIQALFRDVFGDAEGMDRFNRLVFWSNENSGFAVGQVSTQGIVYATDRERARQDIKCITQYLSLPGTLMINVDRRLEGDRRPKHKDSFHNLNGLVQNGCGIFDRGAGFISPAQEILELFTRYIHEYRPAFNNRTRAVRVFDWIHRADPGNHRLLVWREFGNEKEMEPIPIPGEWKGIKQVRVLHLIDQTETRCPVDSDDLLLRIRVDDNPLLIIPDP